MKILEYPVFTSFSPTKARRVCISLFVRLRGDKDNSKMDFWALITLLGLVCIFIMVLILCFLFCKWRARQPESTTGTGAFGENLKDIPYVDEDKEGLDYIDFKVCISK